MAGTEYDVAYVARSPADMKQDDFANIVNEICNGRAVEGWRLVSAAGDYWARVTLGVWLYFAREADSVSEKLGCGGIGGARRLTGPSRAS